MSTTQRAPELSQSQLERPADVDDFRGAIISEVAEIPLNPSTEHDFAGPGDQYQLSRRGGTDNDRIDAWLANELGTGPTSRFGQATV